MPRLIILGSINMDVVVQAQRHPQPGETVFGDALHFIPGGKGANQAVAARRLGAEVRLVARLGQDSFGDTLHAFLHAEGIDLSDLRRLPDVPSGTAIITVDAQSQNRIVVVSGANQQLRPADVAVLPIAPDDVIVAQFEVPQPAIKALFARARRIGARTLLNPAPAAAFMEGLLPLVTHLIVNETELALLAGQPTDAPPESAMRALPLDSAQTLVLTRGAEGALCLHDGALIAVPGRAVQAVDTTGAGDCFVGALAVALSEGQALADGLRFANAAAALSVQTLGASASMPRRDAVDALLA